MSGIKNIATTLVVLFGAATGAAAQSPQTQTPNFLTEVHWVDDRMEARTAQRVLTDCMGNASCRAVVHAAAAYVGIPPQAVESAAYVARVATNRAGEENSKILKPAQGYKFCNVGFQTNSVVPANGHRAAKMSIGAYPHEIGIMTVTRLLPIAQGGSSWTGWFTITQVKIGANSMGRCAINSTRIVHRCKGSGSHGGNCGQIRRLTQQNSRPNGWN